MPLTGMIRMVCVLNRQIAMFLTESNLHMECVYTSYSARSYPYQMCDEEHTHEIRQLQYLDDQEDSGSAHARGTHLHG